jgi:hypothetical protein
VMRRLLAIGAVWLVALFVCPRSAHALTFRVVPDDGFGGRVLVIYDCGRLSEPATCTPEKSRFHPSDTQTLAGYWRQGPFDEVWLLSGGGAVVAGVGIAKDLRAHAQAVRVPGVARLRKAGMVPTRDPMCVSSCTIAFMGGQFRSIDEGATYQVHSASYVQWGDIDASFPAIKQTFEFIQKNGVRAAINDYTSDSRRSARELFTLFQDTLWLPIKPRDPQDPYGARDVERQRREQAFNEWERDRQGVSFPYAAEQQARDEALLAFEGAAALQDIIMREERNEMDRAIREIRSFLPRLGRRGDAALAMLAAMFNTSSILETNSMPRETLIKMGYITEFVK